MEEDDAVVKERFRSRRLKHDREATARRCKYGLMAVPLLIVAIGAAVAMVCAF